MTTKGKKLATALLALACVLTLVFALAACNKDKGQSVTEDHSNSDDPVQQPEEHVHNYTLVEAKNATCTEDGNIQYYTCDCGKIFSTNKNEITKAATVIPATGHDKVTTSWESDGTVHWHKCNNCDEKFDMQAHTEGSEWIEDNVATCIAKAHHHKECSVCGQHMTEEDYGELTAHVLKNLWIEDVAASCTAKAHHHKECANCDYHMVEEDYGELLPHEMSGWIEDNAASCTKKAHHHKECANCDHREDEDYGNLLPHELGDWIIDGEYKCEDTVTRHKDCANCDYTIVDENYIVPHAWKEQLTEYKQKECEKCGYKENVYEERDGKIYFGEYPQTKETDNGITATLAQMSGNRPVRGNSGEWTDYGYYISGSTSEYMWYIDLEYGGERYRGVYFTSYRPYYTTYSSSTNNSEQDDHGYYINTLYWFKWEPIEWRVLEKTDGEAFLMSNVILDSQQYYRTDSGTRSIDGKTVYPNNYKESDIRAWLNGTFYNWAFDELDQSIIKTTLVDNSASTTASSSNSYVCENTNDKVFLLSYKDVLNTSYGFNSSYSNYDTARRLKTTGYAQSQGAYTSTDSSYRGNGWWCLRSPYANHSNDALCVRSNGYAVLNYYVYDSGRGVVPAIKIQL